MELDESKTSLTAYLAQPPAITADASIGYAAHMLRFTGTDRLPVVDRRGVLVGVILATDLAPLLLRANKENLVEPVSTQMRPAAILPARADAEQARAALVSEGSPVLYVVDDRGHYLGAVSVAGLLDPQPWTPRPRPVGGMATPWGVYLTASGIQAGTGNLSLVAGGVVIGLLLAAAHAVSGIAAWVLQRCFALPALALWEAPQPASVSGVTAVWLALRGLEVMAFLLLLRTVPLSRFHAGEHQVVHAMERGEPLVEEIVSRMERVHPRCGTNVMAAGLIFSVVMQGVSLLRLGWLDAGDGAILGAVAAFVGWRGLGAWLQEHFTTRPPAPKHIQAAIRAGLDLERKYLEAPPRTPSLGRRLWCMGLAQTFVGIMIGGGAGLYLVDLVFSHVA
ncbi:MAG: DUF1385 domain-containing protein [Chthonomonadales bacterium]